MNAKRLTVKRATSLVYQYAGVRANMGLDGQETAARIINRMLDTGECVWHATSVITSKKCMCADCN